MSATKELLFNLEQWQAATDNALYDCGCCLASLSNLTWTDDNNPLWAPSREWLAETKTQIRELQAMLFELEAAHDCLKP